ncbi:MAG: N-acetyl sugar amidotransferase [Candidatus Anstonellales archaeon]
MKTMRYCKKCVMPDTRPRIEFDSEGVCNACRYAEMRSKIDWSQMKKKFEAICDRYRSKDGSWDCVVPASGGKDSMLIAYKLKYEYNMHPLAATFAPVLYTGAGWKNIENMRNAGIDNIVLYPDRKVLRKLCKKMLVEFGDPFIPWVTGVYSFPLRVAINYRIPLVVYAEPGEAMYGGSTKIDDKEITEETLRITIKTGSAKDWVFPENWDKLFPEGEITKNDLAPYIYPTQKELDEVNVKAIYFAAYHPWGAYQNYQFVKTHVGFHTLGKRIRGSYQNYSSIDDKIDGLYMYLMYLKFGFARCTKDACKDIRDGRLSREEAIKLVKKYDGEFPYTEKELKEILDFLQMSKKELFQVLEKFRNKDIFEKVNGKWKLKNPIWEQQ